jgi:hypothetical protein
VLWACGALTAGVLWLPACDPKPESSSDNQGGGQGAGPGLPAAGSTGSAQPSDPDSLLQAQAHGYCARLFRCFEGNDDFMSSRLVLKTPEACEAKLRALEVQEPGRRDLHAQLAAGTLHFNASAAAKCVTELSACNGIDSFTEGSCREVYEGSAQTGEACQRNEDCAGDAYCEGSGCPGQCRPRKSSGEPCQYTTDCSYSTGVVFCDYDAMPASVCRTLQAGAKAGLGELCTRRRSADTWVTCTDDLWCGIDETLGADAAQGRCLAPLKTGDPCRDSDDVCVGGLCDTTSGVCVEPVLKNKAGDSCDKSKLIVCDPTLGLRCNDQGTCDGSGDGTQGSRCLSGDFQPGCDAGLYCAMTDDTPTGICQPWLAAGAACSANAACESGVCDATCQPRYCTI